MTELVWTRKKKGNHGVVLVAPGIARAVVLRKSGFGPRITWSGIVFDTIDAAKRAAERNFCAEHDAGMSR